MSIELTEEQSRAIEEGAAAPPSVIDPRTHKRYVLISSAMFERVKTLLNDGDYSLADTYRAQIDAALRAGWDDPAMDAYNDYDARRKP